jgi:WD40 repeat protein
MESLKELLQQCSKETLEEAMENVCELLQVVAQGKLKEVKRAICKTLTKQKRKEQRQQENDRDAFAVVLGQRKILDVVGQETPQEVAGVANGGRGRACTGLMAVGSDVLTIVSTFLAWEKVELQRELKVGGMWEQCSFSPCGNFILTCANVDEDCSALKLWGARSGELVRVFEDCTEEVHDCCFTPDGKTVVTAGFDDMLRLWNVKTGTLSRTLESHTDSVLCVDVSPDGAHILSVISVSGSYGCTVKLWNFPTGANLAGGEMVKCTLPIDAPQCWCCSFSPNGALFLVGDGASLKLYNSTTHQLQHTFTGHSEAVVSCAFAPDGASILSGSYDCTLKLWCTTGVLLRTLYGHTGSVYSCAFSPTGLTIVSGSSDTTLKLWTATTGQLQRTIDAHSSAVNSCCFSPDGKSILSGHNDGSAKLWGVADR